MRKLLLATMLTTIFLFNFCKGQQQLPQPTSNISGLVNSIKLSISLSNGIIATGSKTTVDCQVENSSTNRLLWVIEDETRGFMVFLNGNRGDFYRVTPAPETNSEYINNTYVVTHELDPGSAGEYSVPISIGKEIKPGSYQLVAKLRFHFEKSRQNHELISNFLEVHIYQ